MPALPNEIDCNGSAADINDNFGMDSHIYENLPGSSPKSASPKTPKNHVPVPILRKYFRREAIYENLCAGCGYGVFGAPGRYCHFCQCIVSGGVVVPAAPLTENFSENPSQESNIYENICELCRGIYSDNEKCQCQKECEKENTKDNSSTPKNTTPTPTSTPTPTPLPTPTSLPAAKNNSSRSRTLLNYSKSSAATLTRLFGSLKQLNRSASLQRKLFQREVKAGGGGSLEIIHNVDEVFRTQETFDMQRICQLKSELQLKSSQSDQHIYGRVREPEPDKAERKRPRISRMRLLQQSERDSGSGSDGNSDCAAAAASLYLNESICHWMTSLRQQVHHYDEGAGVWQQLPKSVPAAYEREPTAEEPVTLRKEDKLSLVSDFKRKLQLKREPQERRCGITAEFVNEFLSQSHPQPQVSDQQQPPMAVIRAEEQALPKIPLLPLMQSLALSISLHVCVRGPLSAYDKSLSQWLWEQQQRLLINGYRGRERARDPRHEWRRLFARSVAPRAPSSLLRNSYSLKTFFSSVYVSAARSKRNRREESGASGRAREGVSVGASDSAINNSNSINNNNNSSGSSDCAGGRALMAAPKTTSEAERPNNNNNNNSTSNNNDDNDSSTNSSSSNNNNNNNNNNNMSNCNVSDQQQQQKSQEQQQQITQNCVIKVRRPAPKVPVRSPKTALSNPRQTEAELDKEKHSPTIGYGQDMDVEEEEEEEESIYQPIWQFKTLEHVAAKLEDPDVVQAQHTISEDAEEEDEDEDDDEDEDEEDDEEEVLADYDESLPSDADADVMALQAAAVFAAGVRHKLSTSTLTKRSKLMLPTPLPSPTASMDQGAWETDMEFMFHRESKNAEEAEAAADSLSLGSTITNSTATLGSISSTGSSARQPTAPKDQVPVEQAPLIHPILRNICIFYSPTEPKKYSAIFYEYQRSQIHLRFMTRIRRPAPPPPVHHKQPPPTFQQQQQQQQQQNDDSGCSCEAEDQAEAAIPQPLKEEWARAVLAAGAVATKRGVAARAGRKLRVRSNARLLLTDSVLAWREQLQDVHCCEDEEDMIVPVTDILRAQQIQEDNELQQTQQSTILKRFKSVSIGNLLDLPAEDDKKSIKNRMRMKCKSNRSPKAEKKSRGRRGQVNSLYLDEQKYPLFAAPLHALELNMTDHPNVPRFVVDVCSYIEQPECIEQDGLYRASGNKVLVDELRRKLTYLYDPRLLQTDDIHTLTSLHKQFFRELTSPLITQEAYERLGKSLADDAAIERMSLAFDDMPEPNRSTLRFLIKHLTRVAAASASNRMPSTNLAIVWGPCLLSANQIHLDIGRMNMLAKVLIENYDRIFHADNERLVC
ncbi:hypothetical protein KR054_012524 [Drosophila jambulina]|nr:hypothetical protein KR054_012524 [Drosophila jambulina]